MKKSLLAVAAMTAFAGAAQAQSSVTVYGILDVGYAGGNSRAMSTANTTNGGLSKTTVNQLGQSAEQTSRLGFKGSEDLGGGKSAFFTAEFQLYPQDQESSGNTNSGLLNRQTFVGLKQDGLGQGAIGLQYTPVFNAQAVTDPGMNNNILGNVVYVGSTGTNSSTSGSLSAGAFANNAGLTNRTANTLTVQSDSFAGFRGNAMYTLNNKNATQTSVAAGGNTNASGWGLGADYTLNKLYVNAAYQALKQFNTGTNSTVAFGDCATAVGGAAGTTPCVWTNAQANGATTATGTAATGLTSSYASNVQDNQFFAGATYDFGILKAYAQYINRKATSTANSGYYLSRAAEQIGVRSYITPTVEAWASAGLGRYTAFGQGNPTANFNAWQLGSNYYLSKRTNLYAIYGQVNQTTTSYYDIKTGATVTANSGASNYAIGVRHTF